MFLHYYVKYPLTFFTKPRWIKFFNILYPQILTVIFDLKEPEKSIEQPKEQPKAKVEKLSTRPIYVLVVWECSLLQKTE